MDYLSLAALTFLASTVGTITGFGTSTIMIPVLVLFMPATEAIVLVSIIHWFGNVWKVSLFKQGFDKRLFLLFGLTGLITSYLGAALTLQVNESVLLRGLGAFLVLYALSLLVKTSIKIKATTSVALLGGSLSGFFAGLFGIGGAIRSAFLLLFDLPKAKYIATAGAIGLLVDSTRLITYYYGGAQIDQRYWWGLLAFIPVSYLGAQLAKVLVNKIPQKQFRIVLAVGLLLIGVKLVGWPVV